MNTRKHLLAAAVGTALCAASSAFAGSADTASVSASSSPFSSIESGFKQWWNGSSGLNNWFGLGYPLADHGFSVTGEAKESFYGGVSGGLKNQNQSNWAGEVRLKGLIDFEKLCGIEGLTFESNWRYRQINGQNNTPSTGYAAGTVGPAGNFNPNHMSSGLGMRIMTQFFQWQNEKGKDPRFMIKLGWVNPYQDFLQQPLSKMFQNNMIESSKGIGGAPGNYTTYSSTGAPNGKYKVQGVPWSSSYATWGGSLRAKPTASTYVQSGLYLAIAGASGQQSEIYGPNDVAPYVNRNANLVGTSKRPGGSNPSPYNNHGFNFQGTAPFNPNNPAANYGQNGLYNVNEIGWTPKLGADKLEGKYAVGGYIWGQNNTDFVPATQGSAAANTSTSARKAYGTSQNSTIMGMYFQADQRLYAVKEVAPAAPSMSKNPVDSKNPAPAAAPAVSKTRGLYSFNMFTFSDPQNVALPFYFQSGLVYKGLLDARPLDQMGACFGAGFYSNYYNEYLDKTAVTGRPNVPHYSSTGVLEAFYCIQVNKWATLQPFAEWIVNPAGNGTVDNDLILGASVKCLF
jgi:carbohydrate-selective porin OprB